MSKHTLKTVRTIFLLLTFLALSTGIASATIAKINVDLDRESHMYALGETATFTVSVVDEKGDAVHEGSVTAVFRNSFGSELKCEEIDLCKANPATISGTLNEPGFLTVTIRKNSISGNGGAAFSPEKIEPGQEMPTDFWDYWRGLQKTLRMDVPADFQMEKIDSISNDYQTTYRVSIATFDDQRSHGFFTLPKGEGPFPLLVSVSWAGPGFGPDTWTCRDGFATLHMPIFPYAVGITQEERQKQYDEYNAQLGVRYCYYGAPDRDRFFFRNAYIGIDRLIDTILERPEIDTKRVGYFGTSQGGGSALILGGLNGKFTHILGSVPALCDHGATKRGRQAGWPQIYNNVKNPKVEEMGPYFDGVNFAREIHCPIRLTVGFIDTTCCPSSVFAAFNVIPAEDKVILHEEHRGHDVGQKHSEAMNWLKTEVKK